MYTNCYREMRNAKKEVICTFCGKRCGVYELDGWKEIIISLRELKIRGGGIMFNEDRDVSIRKMFCCEKCMNEYLKEKYGERVKEWTNQPHS